MKNNLTALNNYLFEQIERINDDELKGDELDAALKKLGAVVEVGKTIISSGELALKAKKQMLEYGGDAKINIPLLGIADKETDKGD